MSSMSLGRVKDTPLPLSAIGEDNVMADLRYGKAKSRYSETLNSLTEKYPSIEAAKQDGSTEFANWQNTYEKFGSFNRRLRDAEPQKQYNAYCRE